VETCHPQKCKDKKDPQPEDLFYLGGLCKAQLYIGHNRANKLFRNSPIWEQSLLSHTASECFIIIKKHNAFVPIGTNALCVVLEYMALVSKKNLLER